MLKAKKLEDSTPLETVREPAVSSDSLPSVSLSTSKTEHRIFNLNDIVLLITPQTKFLFTPLIFYDINTRYCKLAVSALMKSIFTISINNN